MSSRRWLFVVCSEVETRRYSATRLPIDLTKAFTFLPISKVASLVAQTVQEGFEHEERGLNGLCCTPSRKFQAPLFAQRGLNDGQKGMGLIMLILIGIVPTAYALNRTMPPSQMEAFVANSTAAAKVVEAKATGCPVAGDPRSAVTRYVALHQINEGTFPSLGALMREIADQVMEYGTLGKIPAAVVRNTRNDMYLASEAIRFLMKDKEANLTKEDVATLNAYKGSLDNATKFIPFWVKLAVAIALGLGTMVGWKRIVVTVGEKIGKTHLTYGQGAAAEPERTKIMTHLVGFWPVRQQA